MEMIDDDISECFVCGQVALYNVDWYEDGIEVCAAHLEETIAAHTHEKGATAYKWEELFPHQQSTHYLRVTPLVSLTRRDTRTTSRTTMKALERR